MTSTGENVLSQSSTTTTPTNPPQSRRTVTFNPQATVKDPRQPASTATDLRISSSGTFSHTLETGRNVTSTQPMLSNLNSKLRRRNSHGSPLTTPPSTPASKIGPQRTTKNAQKLKLLPNPDLGDEGPDEESGRDVYSQFTRIKDPTARRDAARLGKADREKLPRVTAYCTANHYRLEGLMKFLKSRAKTRGAAPKQFDECIYSPYRYPTTKPEKPRPPLLDRRSEVLIDIQEEEEDENFPSPPPQQERRYSDSAIEVNDHSNQRREELIDLHTEAGDTALENGQASIADHINEEPPLPEVTNPDFDTQVHTPEVFLFDYGTVVIWGMTLQQEQRFLKDISKFENERLSEDDVQSEQFNFYYTREYQARIYNDFISLREKKNYMTKLAISHALSQSVKTSLFEDLLSTTITQTHPLPAQLATTGHIALTRRQITMQIGALFILRINIHLQGSVLDSPELLWSEPSLDPVYQAVRGYLEMDQRVGLLTERLEVVGDLLAVLREQVQGRHGEGLEWIVIVLIAVEILVAGVNVLVDLWAGGG